MAWAEQRGKEGGAEEHLDGMEPPVGVGSEQQARVDRDHALPPPTSHRRTSASQRHNRTRSATRRRVVRPAVQRRRGHIYVDTYIHTIYKLWSLSARRDARHSLRLRAAVRAVRSTAAPNRRIDIYRYIFISLLISIYVYIYRYIDI
jgi:hypothetical protein